MLFASYRFEHPKTEKVIRIGGWSYVWAGLFGAFYVAHHGFRKRFLYAFAINIGFAIMTIGMVGVTSFVSPLYQFIALIVLPPGVVLAQGTSMVEIVRNAYRRRGWLVRQG